MSLAPQIIGQIDRPPGRAIDVDVDEAAFRGRLLAIEGEDAKMIGHAGSTQLRHRQPDLTASAEHQDRSAHAGQCACAHRSPVSHPCRAVTQRVRRSQPARQV